MKSKTWGLDIGSAGIKAVEVSRSLRGLRVSRYEVLPLARMEKGDFRGEVLAKLREVFPRLGARGEGLACTFPSPLTMVHRVPLPFADRKKNRQVVKFEAEPFLPFSADQVILDFYSPGKGPDEKRSLIFAVRKKDLGDHLALLKESGLDPESVVPEAMAFFSLVKSLGKASGEGGALLDLGQEKATLILWEKGRLVLARSILLPGTPSASGDASRLAEEVRRSFLSAEWSPEKRTAEKLFLTGGKALLPGLAKQMGDLLQVPVDLLPMEEICPDVPEEARPALAAALGAALGGDSAEGVNLRREEFASSQKARRMKGRLKVLMAYAVLLAVLGIAAFLVNFTLLEKKYRDLKAEIRKEFTQSLPEVKRVVNEVQQMRARVQEERAKLGSFGAGPGGGSPLEILRDLSLMVDPATKVRVTELIVDPETVEVNGEADSFDTVNQLKARLDRSARFKDVQLKAAKASSLENVIEFKFQMKRGV
jgi:general secretion pathway protein L